MRNLTDSLVDRQIGKGAFIISCRAFVSSQETEKEASHFDSSLPLLLGHGPSPSVCLPGNLSKFVVFWYGCVYICEEIIKHTHCVFYNEIVLDASPIHFILSVKDENEGLKKYKKTGILDNQKKEIKRKMKCNCLRKHFIKKHFF